MKYHRGGQLEDYQSQEKANISVNNVTAKDVCVKYVLDGLIAHKGKEFDFGNLYIVEDCIASLDEEKFDQYLDELYANNYDCIKFRTVSDIKDVSV